MLTIADVAARCGVSIPTLRNWESKYAVVAPSRSASGQRRYTEAHLAALSAMATLVRTGWTPRDAAAEVLRRASDGVCPADPGCPRLRTCPHSPLPPPIAARIRVAGTALPPPLIGDLVSTAIPVVAFDRGGPPLEERLDDAVSQLASNTLLLAPLPPAAPGCPLTEDELTAPPVPASEAVAPRA